MTKDEYLKHYGIPGMRWGKRKGNVTITTPGHADYEKTKSMRSKSTHELSNADLKDLNNRLQLERQYKDLTKKEKSKGEKFVTSVLEASGKTVATALVTRALNNMIKKALGV